MKTRDLSCVDVLGEIELAQSVQGVMQGFGTACFGIGVLAAVVGATAGALVLGAITLAAMIIDARCARRVKRLLAEEERQYLGSKGIDFSLLTGPAIKPVSLTPQFSLPQSQPLAPYISAVSNNGVKFK